MKKLSIITILIIVFSSKFLVAQSPAINLQIFSTGYTSPVAIENCGDSRLFIVQQTGYIYICDSLGNKNPTPFLDIHNEISTSSERGLLGLAFHPDYFTNGYFFVYYTKASDGSIRIVRFSVDSLNPNAADPNSELLLKEIPHPNYNNHNGGCLKFGPDGYLYAGTGDGGSGGDPNNNSQNGKKYLGKLLRLDVDDGTPYTIPADNPFVNDTADYYPEIWAYGLRNPWRYSFDHLTGDLWIGDVGQDNWEEVDYMPVDSGGGQNYGWRCYEGTHVYNLSLCTGISNFTFPIFDYPHSSGSDADCTVTGGYIYRGAQFANMYGKYFCADYCSGKIRMIVKNSNGTFTPSLVGDELISGDEFDFSSFGQDRYNELYLAGVTDGKIYRVIDTTCKPTAVIGIVLSNKTVIDSVACTGSTMETPLGAGLNYQWMLNGDSIIGATSSSLIASDTGNYSIIVTNTSGCSNTSSTVKAGAPTVPSFSGLESTYCTYQAPDTLVGIPAGGTFSGTGIAGNVFDPEITGAGMDTITYTYVNQYGCSASVMQTTLVDPCTGINELWEKYGINLFPNPGNGIFTIILKDTNDEITDLSVWNLSGQLITSFNLPSQPSEIFTVNASSLSDGMYLLRVKKGTSVFWEKLVIANQRN